MDLLLGKAGLLLFTLGLAIGFAIQRFRNPRMGLAAHLTAVQTGTFLLAAGLFWPRFGVPAGLEALLGWALVGSSYVLTAGLVAAAATGASEAMPIAGRGFRARAVQEKLVGLAVVGSSAVMLLAAAAVTWFFLPV